jgi:hypothetical protein
MRGGHPARQSGEVVVAGVSDSRALGSGESSIAGFRPTNLTVAEGCSQQRTEQL